MAWWVTVCEFCLRASCWYGEIKCPRRAKGKKMTLSSTICAELVKEPRAFYSREKLKQVTGKEPEEVRL